MNNNCAHHFYTPGRFFISPSIVSSLLHAHGRVLLFDRVVRRLPGGCERGKGRGASERDRASDDRRQPHIARTLHTRSEAQRENSLCRHTLLVRPLLDRTSLAARLPTRRPPPPTSTHRQNRNGFRAAVVRQATHTAAAYPSLCVRSSVHACCSPLRLASLPRPAAAIGRLTETGGFDLRPLTCCCASPRCHVLFPTTLQDPRRPA